MGEFVEQSLEALLPVFEQLSSVQLLSPQEVDALIKRCRRYEYRLQKKQKTPDDFLIYGDYLTEVVVLVKSRRARMEYWHKFKLIDKVLLTKIASIYRRSCDRFQSRLDLWRKLFDFCQKYKSYRILSKAYTRALQIHGRNIELRCESALWEFFSNASAENARTQLQLALRSFPDDNRLYEALFKVECNYVNKIIERRDFLKNKLDRLKKKKSGEREEDDDSAPDDSVFDIDVEDAVLQMKVALVVVLAAVKKVDEKKVGAMLLTMWKDLLACTKLPKESASALKEELEQRISGLDNEDSQLLIIEKETKAGKDVYEAYDAALSKCPTERMYRIYMKFCNDRQDDLFASMKRADLLKVLVEKDWAKEDDYQQVASSIDDVLNAGDRKAVLQKSVEACPTSALFWTELLKLRMDSDDFDSIDKIEDWLNTLNQAFEKVSPEESYPLWELAIDFAITHTPKKVEKVFSSCYLIASPVVSSRVKTLRVEYLDELVKEGKLTKKERDDQIYKLMLNKPNTAEFYLLVVENEKSSSAPSASLIKTALQLTTNEHATSSVESWIAFAAYAMQHEPLTVASIYQRALLSLEKRVCPQFIEQWTRLQQSEAVANKQKEDDISSRKRRHVSEKEDSPLPELPVVSSESEESEQEQQ